MHRTVLIGMAAMATAAAPMAAQAQYAQQPRYGSTPYGQTQYGQTQYGQTQYGQGQSGQQPYYGAQAGAQAGVQGSPLNSIFNCQAGGNKQAGGAAIGGVVGGLLGSQVAKNERTLGTVIGAAAGAALGSYVGCRMQVSDQQRAYAAAQTALQTGAYQTWSNPQTGASGSTRVIDSYGQASGYGQSSGYGAQAASDYGQPVSLAGLRVARNVQLQTQLETAASRQVQAPGRVNLRAGPSTRTAVVGQLAAGETVEALARVQGQNWLLVGRNGVGVGYVSESVMRPLATQTYASAGGYAQTSSQTPCRVIEQSVNTPGAQPVIERYRACRSADGEWNVTRV